MANVNEPLLLAILQRLERIEMHLQAHSDMDVEPARHPRTGSTMPAPVSLNWRPPSAPLPPAAPLAPGVCDVDAALASLVTTTPCMEHRSYAPTPSADAAHAGAVRPMFRTVADVNSSTHHNAHAQSFLGFADPAALPILVTHYPPLSTRRAKLEDRLAALGARDVTWILCANREDVERLPPAVFNCTTLASTRRDPNRLLPTRRARDHSARESCR